MKVAVSSQAASLDAQVDQRFGRARTFIIYDTESGEYTAADNTQNLNSAQGAGIQAAETIIREKAEYLITGNCGPKAFKLLSSMNIGVYTGAEGTVRQALDRFTRGDLTAAKSATVEGHWV